MGHDSARAAPPAIDLGSRLDAELPPGDWTRIYVGSAFCFHLLPSARQWERVLERLGDLPLSATTPPLGPTELDRAASALEPLLGGEAEIVFNDWGLFRRLRPRHEHWRLGRLLHRQVRDPRAAAARWERAGLGGVPEHWRQASGGAAAFRELLDDLGIAGWEVDLPPHGLLPEALGPSPSRAALHLGWMPVATGRQCVARAAAHGTLRPGERCSAPCRGQQTRLRLGATDDPELHSDLVERGNTVFAPLPSASVELYVQRLVYAPEPPL